MSALLYSIIVFYITLCKNQYEADKTMAVQADNGICHIPINDIGKSGTGLNHTVKHSPHYTYD